MRDIKFRIYDKNNFGKKMLYSSTEYFDDMLAFRFNHFDSDPEDLVIMQFTGLKDANGAEIYEGDIVEIDDYIAVLQWDITTSRLIINLIHENVIYDFDNTYVSELEVVGNIYENADLLEVD